MSAQVSEMKVRDVAIKLHHAGRGPAVLFLHGAGGVPQWLPLFDTLAESYELLVPEHPGFGGSDDPAWIRSMPDLAMFYLDLVEEAGLDRIHLIGNSLGGWLAAEILIRDRSRFRSLVQLAPAGIRVKGMPCGDNVESSEATAAKIPGVRFQPMQGIGHFPFAENRKRFAEYLLPILAELKG